MIHPFKGLTEFITHTWLTSSSVTSCSNSNCASALVDSWREKQKRVGEFLWGSVVDRKEWLRNGRKKKGFLRWGVEKKVLDLANNHDAIVVMCGEKIEMKEFEEEGWWCVDVAKLYSLTHELFSLVRMAWMGMEVAT